MCGIAGFVNFTQDFTRIEKCDWRKVAKDMGNTLLPRGPDGNGVFVCESAVFAHTRLAVLDLEFGMQPMTKSVGGFDYTITYNGQIYNADELRNDLAVLGYKFLTKSDTEVLLCAYIHYGVKCAEKLNGVFAFVIWDGKEKRAFLCRDRFGVKPLFYSFVDDTLVFGSEIKALLKFPGIRPRVDRLGMAEVFAIGPARTEGFGIFKDISELCGGEFAIFDKNGFRKLHYWWLESKPHADSFGETVEKVEELAVDAITRQLASDVPVCAFLSGGLDSSVICAVAAKYMKERGERLNTFSFDYAENDKYFAASDFQPETDRPWVERVTKLLDTKHHFLECDIQTLFDNIYEAVRIKDLPGMADVDSSLVYFGKEVSGAGFKVALSGECADEIFGGYPWFHDSEAFDAATFPWARNIAMRKLLLKPEMVHELDIDNHIDMRYFDSLASFPKLSGETAEEARRREITYLNIKWFMTTLLERSEQMCMASGLEVRVPYADHRLAEYVFNTPWEFKSRNGIRKTLLREAAAGLLPNEILYRKKSPYPKTYHPKFEKLVADRLKEIINDSASPILDFIDKTIVANFIDTPSDYGKPFFGQLMAGPQMMGRLIQIDYWLREYKIEIS